MLGAHIPARSGRTCQRDIDVLIRDLGGDVNVLALYDVRCNLTRDAGGFVSEWADVRGAGGLYSGPTFSQVTPAQRPAYTPATGTVDFDGVDDRMVASGGRTAELTGPFAFGIIADRPSFGPVRTYMEAYVSPSNDNVLSLWQDNNVTNSTNCTAGRAGPLAQMGAHGPGRRVNHARRSAVTAGPSVTAGIRGGTGPEVTAVGNPGADDVANALILGCHRLLGGFTDAKVRAILIYKGDDYTSANRWQTFNTWAQTYHGGLP